MFPSYLRNFRNIATKRQKKPRDVLKKAVSRFFIIINKMYPIEWTAGVFKTLHLRQVVFKTLHIVQVDF